MSNGYIDVINKLEAENDIIILVFSREDIASGCDMEISDDCWVEIKRQFNKAYNAFDGESNFELLCLIARDVCCEKDCDDPLE